MLKVNDKNIYTKEIREMFDEYEKTMKNHKLDSKMQSCVDTCESVVELIDNLINAARSCPDSTVKARLYLILSIVGGMISSQLEEYTSEKLNDIDELDKLINTLEKIVNIIGED